MVGIAKKGLLVVLASAVLVGAVFAGGAGEDDSSADMKQRIVIVPGNLGNPYFEACRNGAFEAGEELGVEVIYQGSAQPIAEQQIEVIETLIGQGVDGMAISSVDADALVPVAQKAMRAGIEVVSYDTPIAPAGRSIDVMPADNEVIGRTLGRTIAEMIGGEGQVAILSSTSTFFATNEWNRYTKLELSENFPDIEVVTTVYGDDLPDKSYREALALFNSYPDLKGIVSPTSIGVVAAAKAVQDEGLIDQIEVTGLGLPSEMQEYILSGACKRLILWNPVELGYAATVAVYRLVTGENTGAEGEEIDLGKLGTTKILADGQVFMGDSLFEFNKDNIHEWSTVF